MLNNEDYLNIFHEIKNSVTLVNGSLQLVAKKHPEVRHFEYWREVMFEIDFLKNMVTQLSSVRMCNQINPIQLNLYSFMHQFSSSIHALSWKDFNCNIILDEDLPQVEFDPQLIKQALVNIIKNAYEAMHSSCLPVNIHVSSPNQNLQISITDYAGGLNPAIANTVFEPFITSKNGGSGLGLVITKQIIEAHHGTLTCESRPGDGCTFTITLPLMQS